MVKSVRLQDRMNGDIHLNLWAGLEDNGDFTINGMDLGSRDSDGDRSEYEWTVTVSRENVPALARLLGSLPDEDVLETVERKWVKVEGEGLDKLIRESDVPSELEMYIR